MPWQRPKRLLTRQKSGNYSVRMLEEMDTLETKLELLLERHRVMHAENLRLRQQVVAMENANKLLTDRLSEARGRMEKLFSKLPD